MNFFTGDVALVEAMKANGASWAAAPGGMLERFGAHAGAAETARRAAIMHRNVPRWHPYDHYGNRVDRLEYDDSYHWMMAQSLEAGVPSLPWTGALDGDGTSAPAAREPSAGLHVARGAMAAMCFQAEPGHACPISMTFSAVPALDAAPEMQADLGPLLAARHYDGGDKPFWGGGKGGITAGMSMTEKQGGSDVRANTTVATSVSAADAAAAFGSDAPEWVVGEGQCWQLRGHKWFTSAANSDIFLSLAQTESGISCFLVPRWLPNGERNKGFRIASLKSKLGDRSNASSEIEYDNAVGFLIGEPGRGIQTIINMVNHTRLDCALGSTGLMRQAVRHAGVHCRGRFAFGAVLQEQPLMQRVLADLSAETEAATAGVFSLAAMYDRCLDAEAPVELQQSRRLTTAVLKYAICKRAVPVIAEALECLGGNGYDERHVMERHFRQAPLNSLWEGSGNVQCLEVLRTCAKEQLALPTLLRDVAQSQEALGSQYAALLGSVSSFAQRMGAGEVGPMEAQAGARWLVESLATLTQAHALATKGDADVAAHYVDMRLGSGAVPLMAMATYGSSVAEADGGRVRKLVDRLTDGAQA